jgi:hypothetical protein
MNETVNTDQSKGTGLLFVHALGASGRLCLQQSGHGGALLRRDRKP